MSQHGSLPQTPKSACVFLTHTCTHTPPGSWRRQPAHVTDTFPESLLQQPMMHVSVPSFYLYIPSQLLPQWAGHPLLHPPPPGAAGEALDAPHPHPGTLAGGGGPAQSPLVLPTRTAARRPPGLVITTERRSLSEERAFFLN